VSLKNYPKEYKFIGTEFSLDLDIKETSRSYPDLLDAFGEIGGL
jgi:hypothetical protein